MVVSWGLIAGLTLPVYVLAVLLSALCMVTDSLPANMVEDVNKYLGKKSAK